jgi:hypothetical protein
MKIIKLKFFILVSVLALSGCSSSNSDESFIFKCADKIKSESISTDRNYIATVFSRDCGGATSLGSTIVNLRQKSESFNPDNNEVFVIESDNEINLEWLQKNKLVIKYYLGNEVFRKETKWKNTSISYQILKN